MDSEDLFPQSESPSASAYPVALDNSELVFGFVGAVGVNLSYAEDAAKAKLEKFGYRVVRIHVTRDVLPQFDRAASQSFPSDFARIWKMMDIGTTARAKFGSDIIALGVAAAIRSKRNPQSPRTAYLVHSLKHPDEVRKLREIYPGGFYLVGVHSPAESRRKALCSRNGIGRPEAKRLMDRDRKENREFGQQLVDTFHLSDFFVGWEENDDPEMHGRSIQLLQNSVCRFLEIVFGHPYKTPTFGEYAMFLAFATALRSADLSRQVGAVIARDGEIIGMGANDCPRAGGGLYWPTLDQMTLTFEDLKDGRDWTRQGDSNRRAQIDLVEQVVEIVREEMSEEVTLELSRLNVDQSKLEMLERGLVRKLQRVLLTNTRIADLTEFGRVVHAEMEALLSCARKGVSTVGATLYSTTFPCHNCAKHIIASGIKQVVFIEPYLKSRAMDFHKESTEIAYPVLSNHREQAAKTSAFPKVKFQPFFGVGPRKFFDLFSMDIGIGYPLVRKHKRTGDTRQWSEKDANVRVQMKRESYLDREKAASRSFRKIKAV